MSLAAQVDLISKVRYGVCAIGIVSNITTALIFSRKTFRNNSIGIYCRAQALVDLLMLSVQFINQSFTLFSSSDIFSQINPFCKFVMYSNSTTPAISAWIEVVFSIDKLICVIYPQRFEFIRKRSFQLKVMATIAILNLIFYIEVPIYGYIQITYIKNAANITTTSYVCNLKSLFFYQTIYIVNLIQAFFLPFALMLTSSVLTIRALYKTRKRIEAHENRENKSRRAKDTKFAISSIVLNLLFILLTTPTEFTYLITIPDRATSVLTSYICILFFNVNFSKSLFVYLASNSIFRKEFFGLIKSINPRHISVQSFTANSQHNQSKRFTVDTNQTTARKLTLKK